jgi:hypothetical protein
VGFVDQGGSFAQVLSFPTTAQYILSFQEAGIGIYTVFLDGAPIVASHLAPAAFSPMVTSFEASAGTHTLTFQDTDPRDIAGPLPAFVDAVVVAPEPASLAGFAAAAALLASGRRFAKFPSKPLRQRHVRPIMPR